MSLAMTSDGRTEMASDVVYEVLDGINLKTAWEDSRQMMLDSQVRRKKCADPRPGGMSSMRGGTR